MSFECPVGFDFEDEFKQKFIVVNGPNAAKLFGVPWPLPTREEQEGESVIYVTTENI